jgi:schlafen family protein
MNDSLLEGLLREGESSSLDFKRDQYAFSGASPEDKSELLKDVLAFANAWRRDTAYILIGVDEVPGGRSTPVGVAHHLNDHELQQFVNSRTNRPIEFGYLAYDFQGIQLGILQIPVQRRPYYLEKDYGRLTRGHVYLRRGSSTAIATPDEIAEMGIAAQASTRRAPTFDFQILDWTSREPIGDSTTLVTGILDATMLQRPAAPHYLNALAGSFQKSDRDFFNEVVDYVQKTNYFEPIGFWLQNTGTEPARSVVASIIVPKLAGMKLSVDGPVEPSRERVYLGPGIIEQLRRGRDPDPTVDERVDHWRLTIPFDLLNPKADSLSTSPLWLGADTRCTVELAYKIFAEGLANPAEGVLKVVVEPTTRQMTLQDIDPLLRRD